MDEVEVRVRRDAGEGRVLAAADDLVPADVGERRGVVEADRPAGQEPERLGAVLVRALEQELEPEADAEERPVLPRPTRAIGSTKPPARSRSIAGAAAPTPGTTSRSAPSISSPLVAQAHVGAGGAQRLVDRHEVARAVVHDDDERPAARRCARSSERALRRRDALAPRIGLARDPQRAAERLERRLGEVVVVAARAAQVERGAGGPRERLQRVVDELERELPGALARGTGGR